MTALHIYHIYSVRSNSIYMIRKNMASLAIDLKQLPYGLNQTMMFYFVLFLISLLMVFKVLSRKSKSNLPPSPPKLPFIGNLHQLGTLPHRSFQALSQQYGPLMLLQLGQTPTLVVSSADVVKEILKSHDVVFPGRPQTTGANVFLYGCNDVGFAPYGEEWRQKRKVCGLELLSLKRVRSFQFVREEGVQELIKNIHGLGAGNGVSVNLSEMLIATSNNIISRCVFGLKYDAEDRDKSFGKLGRKMMSQITAFSFADFFPSLGWIDVVTGLIQKQRATFGALDAFLDKLLAEHESISSDSKDPDKKDFVEILLQLRDSGMLDFHLTQDNLKAIVMDMIVGGSDTSSTAIEWAVAELMRNPIAMKKAQQEVRRVMGNESKVDENNINQMSYIKCVIKETFRLHPPVPLLVPRETTSDVKLGGYDIPSKTRVFINAWAIQRDPKFWDQPEKFIPERFENNLVDLKGQDFQFIPFGTGRRGCPGMAFGIASVEFVLANLLYWFDWRLPASVQDLDMSERSGLAVSKKVPLHLEPIPYTYGFKP